MVAARRWLRAGSGTLTRGTTAIHRVCCCLAWVLIGRHRVRCTVAVAEVGP
jgi:hypothetical protein